MQAGMLACPNCGAPSARDTVSCSYCHARLQTVSCPSCMGMNFLGSKHCAHCGEKLEPPSSTSLGAFAGEKKCPRCQHALAACAVGGTFLDECGGCGGLWVDADSFQRLCENQKEQAAYLGSGSPLVAPHPQDPSLETVRYVPCPQCQKLMTRINFARCSGVIVDVCKGHGTWFDRDELREILEFIRAGGLERAREHEKEALEHERQRLKDAQAAAMQPAPPAEAEYGSVVSAASGLLRWLLS